MEEIQTLQQINILGDATLSGQINIINDTNSTSYTTGSIVTAGGIGIAKDAFINGTLNANKMNLIDASGTTLGSQYFSNAIWNIENNVGTGVTKSVDISQTGVTINQTTSATSTTTGALTVAGGISTQDSVWAKGNIVATDASSSITITPITPVGADSSIKNGIIMNNSNSSSSGVVNDASGNLLVGINTAHFGTRTTSNQGGVVKISTTSSSPLFDFSVLPSGSTESMSALTIDQNGIIKINATTESTTTTSGSLQISGGVGVVKNVNINGSISLWDGLNSGTISQSGTNLNITATNINLTGNVNLTGNIQINGNVTLNGEAVSSGGSSSNSSSNSSSSSTLDYKVLDDCILHTHIYNMANPTTTKTMLTSSYPLKDYSPTSSLSLSQNVLYFYPVRLIQGQIIKGVFFWSNSTNTTVRTGLYSPDGTLKVSLDINQTITGNNMKYLPLTNSTWSVDSTNI